MPELPDVLLYIEVLKPRILPEYLLLINPCHNDTDDLRNEALESMRRRL